LLPLDFPLSPRGRGGARALLAKLAGVRVARNRARALLVKLAGVRVARNRARALLAKLAGVRVARNRARLDRESRSPSRKEQRW
jgi:hypothetical protein